LQVGLLAGSLGTLGGGVTGQRRSGVRGRVGDRPVVKTAVLEGLLAKPLRVEIVPSLVASLLGSLGAWLLFGRRARASPAWAAPSWAASPRAASRGLAARARIARMGRLGWAAQSIGVSFFLENQLAYDFM
jgi:hypothetical protein